MPSNRSVDLAHRGADLAHRGSDTAHRGSDTAHRGSDTAHPGSDTAHTGSDTAGPRASRWPLRLLTWAALTSLALGFAPGCGAVSASTALNEASRDLREAQQQQADKFAPYHYTRAETYLRKAKELNGMGQYQVAGEYARVSQEASTKSLEVARVNKDQAARREKFAPKKSGSDAPKLPGE
jgi:hypothetical protein